MGAVMRDSVGLTEAQRERAEFIERMTRELGRIATAAELHFVAYLLEMASEEAGLVRDSRQLRAVPMAPTAQRHPRVSSRS